MGSAQSPAPLLTIQAPLVLAEPRSAQSPPCCGGDSSSPSSSSSSSCCWEEMQCPGGPTACIPPGRRRRRRRGESRALSRPTEQHKGGGETPNQPTQRAPPAPRSCAPALRLCGAPAGGTSSCCPPHHPLSVPACLSPDPSSFPQHSHRDGQDSHKPLQISPLLLSSLFPPTFSSLSFIPLQHPSAGTLPKPFTNIPSGACFPGKCRIGA